MTWMSTYNSIKIGIRNVRSIHSSMMKLCCMRIMMLTCFTFPISFFIYSQQLVNNTTMSYNILYILCSMRQTTLSPVLNDAFDNGFCGMICRKMKLVLVIVYLMTTQCVLQIWIMISYLFITSRRTVTKCNPQTKYKKCWFCVFTWKSKYQVFTKKVYYGNIKKFFLTWHEMSPHTNS